MVKQKNEESLALDEPLLLPAQIISAERERRKKGYLAAKPAAWYLAFLELQFGTRDRVEGRQIVSIAIWYAVIAVIQAWLIPFLIDRMSHWEELLSNEVIQLAMGAFLCIVILPVVTLIMKLGMKRQHQVVDQFMLGVLTSLQSLVAPIALALHVLPATVGMVTQRNKEFDQAKLAALKHRAEAKLDETEAIQAYYKAYVERLKVKWLGPNSAIGQKKRALNENLKKTQADRSEIHGRMLKTATGSERERLLRSAFESVNARCLRLNDALRQNEEAQQEAHMILDEVLLTADQLTKQYDDAVLIKRVEAGEGIDEVLVEESNQAINDLANELQEKLLGVHLAVTGVRVKLEQETNGPAAQMTDKQILDVEMEEGAAVLARLQDLRTKKGG